MWESHLFAILRKWAKFASESINKILNGFGRFFKKSVANEK